MTKTTTKKQTLSDQFRRARAAGVPLMAIRSNDPQATIGELRKVIAEGFSSAKEHPPIYSWDAANGLLPVNERAQGVDLLDDPMMGTSFIELVTSLYKRTTGLKNPQLPPEACVFVHNAHRLWQLQDNDTLARIQGIWNLRDALKSCMVSLVLFIDGGSPLPPELQRDVMIFDEELPSDEQIADILRNTYTPFAEENGLPALTPAIEDAAVRALSGLAAFPAEQVIATNIGRSGLDVRGLWSRKKSMIEQTPGLKVDEFGVSFKDIGGCDNVKDFFSSLFSESSDIRLVGRFDELEKMLGGAQSDTSGVSQDALGQVLSFMQDEGILGCLFFGPPGSAKSLMSKAIGSLAGVPTISVDLGATKSSLVGSSEERIRTAMKVIKAVSQGKALFIGTCNKMFTIPPELRRRFKAGLYMFDLPSEAERREIWPIQLKKHGITADELPDDGGWTGAEIDACCELAARLRRPVTEAARWIVPVSLSSADEIQRLRDEAHNKFLSSNYPGLYDKMKAQKAATTVGGGEPQRKMRIVQ